MPRSKICHSDSIPTYVVVAKAATVILIRNYLLVKFIAAVKVTAFKDAPLLLD